MGLFSRKKPEPEFTPEEIEKMNEWSSCSTFVGHSFGTTDLDEVLELFAPKHEAMLKELRKNQELILENQRRIMEQLDALRYAHQETEKTAAPSYIHVKPNAR